ncbi:hypothetical protein EYF80_022281 [Liparis tanakae]|uniref:Uncharacterized protein n=1 Tax=Liparis tanakae TaxID=230148 RepID=A0A4Z2HQB8_9TELE|nr:hypothetical protein EYF80_022281 [Liparis tanakae]
MKKKKKKKKKKKTESKNRQGRVIIILIILTIIIPNSFQTSRRVDNRLYLEDEELLSEDGQRVEASVTDVGFGVGVGGLGPLGGAMGSGMAVVFTGVRGRVEARGGDERSHDGRGVERVLQAEGVAQLVHRHQEQVVAWRRGGGGGELSPWKPEAKRMVMSTSRLPVSSALYGTASKRRGVTPCQTSNARRMASCSGVSVYICLEAPWISGQLFAFDFQWVFVILRLPVSGYMCSPASSCPTQPECGFKRRRGCEASHDSPRYPQLSTAVHTPTSCLPIATQPMRCIPAR